MSTSYFWYKQAVTIPITIITAAWTIQTATNSHSQRGFWKLYNKHFIPVTSDWA